MAFEMTPIINRANLCLLNKNNIQGRTQLSLINSTSIKKNCALMRTLTLFLRFLLTSGFLLFGGGYAADGRSPLRAFFSFFASS